MLVGGVVGDAVGWGVGASVGVEEGASVGVAVGGEVVGSRVGERVSLVLCERRCRIVTLLFMYIKVLSYSLTQRESAAWSAGGSGCAWAQWWAWSSAWRSALTSEGP